MNGRVSEMLKEKKKFVNRALIFVGLSNFLLFLIFFLTGDIQNNPMQISIYATILFSWNFLSIVNIIVIGQIGQKNKVEVAR